MEKFAILYKRWYNIRYQNPKEENIMYGTVEKDGEQYNIISRGYNSRQDLDTDIPPIFRKEGSIIHYDEKTHKWYLVIPK